MNNSTNKPDIIYIQETWLKSNPDFVITGKGYSNISRDEGKGGGIKKEFNTDYYSSKNIRFGVYNN